MTEFTLVTGGAGFVGRRLVDKLRERGERAGDEDRATLDEHRRRQGDEFVGVVHSVIRSLAPEVRVIDISHAVAPHDVRAGGLTLARSVPYMAPGVVLDPTDGKLVHLDGLNLSRAWALENIAASLPAEDARIPALHAAASHHRESGLASVTGEHYEGGHWLASFATYLVTSRGAP